MVVVVVVSVVDEVVEVAAVVVGAVVEVVEAQGAEPGVVQRSSSSLIGTPVFSSPKGKTISLSQRISFLEKVFMARSGYPSKAALTTRRSSIVYGIPSGVSWQQVFWVVWGKFLLNPERRSCTSVLLAARVSVT